MFAAAVFQTLREQVASEVALIRLRLSDPKSAARHGFRAQSAAIVHQMN
jgi:hypothetical protein